MRLLTITVSRPAERDDLGLDLLRLRLLLILLRLRMQRREVPIEDA